eukprot:426677-Amphidinium_carterae.1
MLLLKGQRHDTQPSLPNAYCLWPRRIVESSFAMIFWACFILDSRPPRISVPHVNAMPHWPLMAMSTSFHQRGWQVVMLVLIILLAGSGAKSEH